jgi:anti-sigma regulatory factor (Ser/Thr protein kinase)
MADAVKPSSPVTEHPGATRRGRETGRSLRLELRREPDAAAAARAAVREWCPDLAGGPARRETLLLLVSELVTNAVLHSQAPADAPIRVRASVDEQRVRVEVTDAGKRFTRVSREPPRPGARTTIGGYGLYVVEQAANRWGVDRACGTRVWFEI